MNCVVVSRVLTLICLVLTSQFGSLNFIDLHDHVVRITALVELIEGHIA